MQHQTGKAPLDEVMMAMDVVDTLRHQKLLVDRELNSEEREQKLIERLGTLYAFQGIEVPVSILAEGVRALEEDRFTYQPPAPGIQTRLARFYIVRGRWGRRAGLLMLAVLLVWGAWILLVTLAENRRIESELSELNAEISTATASLQQTRQELKRLQELQNIPLADVSDEMVQTNERTRRQASKSLAQADLHISSAEASAPSSELTLDNFAEDAPVVRQNLAHYREATSDAWASLAVSVKLMRSVYQRVAADKQDDGIIQKRNFDKKHSGFLQPEYSIQTKGAMITSW